MYQLQVPPFEITRFDTLSATQAKEFFHWYLSDIPTRLSQLQILLDEETNGELKLTKDVSSLEPLWEWFSKRIKVRNRTEEEIDSALKGAPAWLRPTIIADNRKLTTETLSVGMDIAIHFAEVMVANNPSIHWGYFTKPKSRVSVNEPVLLGFVNGMELNPRHILNNLMLGRIRGKNNSITETYNTWLHLI